MHRLRRSNARPPLKKRRAHCGWRVGSYSAPLALCGRTGSGKLCRKYFREAGLRKAGSEEDEDNIGGSRDPSVHAKGVRLFFWRGVGTPYTSKNGEKILHSR